MKNLTLKVAVVTAGIITATYLLGANSEGSVRRSIAAPKGATGIAPVVASANAATTLNSTLDDIDRLIRDTETQIGKTPTSSGLDLLARLLLSRGRITGDAASYANAEVAATRSLAIAPRNPEAQTIHSEVLYANHEFAEAGATSRAIFEADPLQVGALAVLGDSLRELGDYVGAGSVIDRLDKLAPGSPSVVVRRARLQVLNGQPELAASTARRAEAAAEDSGLLGPTLAFYSSFRGQIAYDSGDYKAALQHYDAALGLADGDRVASYGKARTLAALGRLGEARLLLRELTDRYPDPASLALLEDVYSATGDRAAAEQTGGIVEAVAGIARSNQQIYNRELALYYANHDRNLPEALRLARAEILKRKDVYAYDTLAWAEYKSGNIPLAVEAAERALATGIRDASVLYHSGMIAIADRNNPRGAKLLAGALQLSPAFDIRQAPIARAALAKVR